MHHIARGIAVSQNDIAVLIVITPLTLVGGKAVNGKESRGRKGVYIGCLFAKSAAQVHAHECRGIIGIVGKFNAVHLMTICFQMVVECLGLCCLAAAVASLDYD